MQLKWVYTLQWQYSSSLTVCWYILHPGACLTAPAWTFWLEAPFHGMTYNSISLTYMVFNFTPLFPSIHDTYVKNVIFERAKRLLDHACASPHACPVTLLSLPLMETLFREHFYSWLFALWPNCQPACVNNVLRIAHLTWKLRLHASCPQQQMCIMFK